MKNRITLAALVLLLGLQANAQIIYTDLIPDVTVNTWNAHTITLSSQPLRTVVIWYHPWSPNEVVIQTMMDDCEILWDAGARYPAKLDEGAAIGSSGTWGAANYDTLNVGGIGNWAVNATDKYIGFRYKTTGQWHYGWIRLDVDQTPTQFTIKDWAYQSGENQSLQAGEKGSTGLKGNAADAAQFIHVDGNMVRFSGIEPAKNYHYFVYDLKGQLLVNMDVNAASTFNLDGYTPGMYIVALSGYGADKKMKLLVR